eukprot:GHVU01160352.1.p1 GENE.GHVU01160352.1~~GHVU01160352.1.p1  ORF type:complete len:637 (+),score=54.45 GHVU01160352.1:3865-5775(+)
MSPKAIGRVRLLRTGAASRSAHAEELRVRSPGAGGEDGSRPAAREPGKRQENTYRSRSEAGVGTVTGNSVGVQPRGTSRTVSRSPNGRRRVVADAASTVFSDLIIVNAHDSPPRSGSSMLKGKNDNKTPPRVPRPKESPRECSPIPHDNRPVAPPAPSIYEATLSPEQVGECLCWDDAARKLFNALDHAHRRSCLLRLRPSPQQQRESLDPAISGDAITESQEDTYFVRDAEGLAKAEARKRASRSFICRECFVAWHNEAYSSAVEKQCAVLKARAYRVAQAIKEQTKGRNVRSTSVGSQAAFERGGAPTSGCNQAATSSPPGHHRRDVHSQDKTVTPRDTMFPNRTVSSGSPQKSAAAASPGVGRGAGPGKRRRTSFHVPGGVVPGTAEYRLRVADSFRNVQLMKNAWIGFTLNVEEMLESLQLADVAHAKATLSKTMNAFMINRLRGRLNRQIVSRPPIAAAFRLLQVAVETHCFRLLQLRRNLMNNILTQFDASQKEVLLRSVVSCWQQHAREVQVAGIDMATAYHSRALYARTVETWRAAARLSRRETDKERVQAALRQKVLQLLGPKSPLHDDEATAVRMSLKHQFASFDAHAVQRIQELSVNEFKNHEAKPIPTGLHNGNGPNNHSHSPF